MARAGIYITFLQRIGLCKPLSDPIARPQYSFLAGCCDRQNCAFISEAKSCHFPLPSSAKLAERECERLDQAKYPALSGMRRMASAARGVGRMERLPDSEGPVCDS